MAGWLRDVCDFLLTQKLYNPDKTSYVNASGIPPAPHNRPGPVLGVGERWYPCPGREGRKGEEQYPCPTRGMEGRISLSWIGDGELNGGHPCPGPGGGERKKGTPVLTGERRRGGSVPLSWPGDRGGVREGVDLHLTWSGVLPLSLPPLPGGQTENITFPHPSNAGGNNLTKGVSVKICFW